MGCTYCAKGEKHKKSECFYEQMKKRPNMKNYKGTGMSKTAYLKELRDRKNSWQKAFDEAVKQGGKFCRSAVSLYYYARDARWKYERAVSESKQEAR